MDLTNNSAAPLRLYWATVQTILYRCSPVAGVTYTLSVRASRDVNTAAMAEATGVIGTDGVTFSLDTGTQTFKEAVAGGERKCWLEIYDGATQVYLQRQVVCVPRAGAPTGQPPAPLDVYIATVSSMPTAASGQAGHTYLYIGTTTATYTENHVYRCVESSGTYSWQDITPGGVYSALSGKPKINGNELIGDKTATELGLQNRRSIIAAVENPAAIPCEDHIIYTHTLVANETIRILTPENGWAKTVELWLTQPSTPVSFIWGNSITWVDEEGYFDADNPPPVMNEGGCMYCLVFLYDGTGWIANHPYTKRL